MWHTRTPACWFVDPCEGSTTQKSLQLVEAATSPVKGEYSAVLISCMCDRTINAEFTTAIWIHPHLHLFDHLLAEGADLGGAGDGHVLGALVLAGDTVEGCGVVLHVVIQVRLAKTEHKTSLPTSSMHAHLLQPDEPGDRSTVWNSKEEKQWWEAFFNHNVMMIMMMWRTIGSFLKYSWSQQPRH